MTDKAPNTRQGSADTFDLADALERDARRELDAAKHAGGSIESAIVSRVHADQRRTARFAVASPIAAMALVTTAGVLAVNLSTHTAGPEDPALIAESGDQTGIPDTGTDPPVQQDPGDGASRFASRALNAAIGKLTLTLRSEPRQNAERAEESAKKVTRGLARAFLKGLDFLSDGRVADGSHAPDPQNPDPQNPDPDVPAEPNGTPG